jgi:hypothetical protein
MPHHYSKKLLAVIVITTIIPSITFAVGKNELVNSPLTTLTWETTKEGVGFAPLEGNRFEEPYMAMVRLPAGLVSPLHAKTANMYGIVVSGVLANVSAQTGPLNEVNLPAGSWYKIPANLPHVSKCVSDVDCITFLYQDGKFDFLPVEK